MLGCPKAIDEEQVPGESSQERAQRYRLKFQQTLLDHPDARSNLGHLFRCWISGRGSTTPARRMSQSASEDIELKGFEGLAKLIKACNEALESGLGLFLACD